MAYNMSIGGIICYWKNPSLFCLVLAAGLLFILVPSTASANGLREDRPWQFQSSADRVNKGAVLDLILKEKAGMYKGAKYTTNITNHTTYDIAGPYIDCNMTSQALGNQGSVSQDAPMGSPTIGVSSSTSSSATGNSGSSSLTSSGGGTSQMGLVARSADGQTVNNEVQPGSPGVVGPVNTNQTNDGSTQSSAASGNTFDSNVSGVSATGGGASVSLNSSQSLTGSPVSSAITDSSVCNFNVVSGSDGSPINSGDSSR